jgi:zinc protease
MLIGRFNTPAGYPLELFVLSNGHRVLIEKRPTDVISLRSFIQTGSINENPIFASRLYGFPGSPSGLAHLDEHCHFLTTQHFPTKYAWTSAVSDLGAEFNASTSAETIQHELLFNREDITRVLNLHAEEVLNPKYDPELIRLEKTNVINEIGERSRPPIAKIHNKLSELLYDRPDFQTHGRIQDILSTTAQDLERFHQRWVTPTRMLTVISGNVDADSVIDQLERSFGSRPARPDVSANARTQLALGPAEVRSATLTDPELAQSLVNVAFPAPARNQLKDRMTMMLIQTLLNGSPNGLLDEVLKDQTQLASDVSVGYEPLRGTGSFEVLLSTQPGREKEALATTLGTLGRLAIQPLPPEKLSELKNRMVQGFEASLENVETVSMALGEEALSQSLPFYLNFRELANSITQEDVIRVATQYLSPLRYAVVFGVPPQHAGATNQWAP